jgi:hypothetical protein
MIVAEGEQEEVLANRVDGNDKEKDSAESFSDILNTIAPEVDPTTCVTRWTGEDCDYGMAIDGLLIRDGR